MDSGRLTLAPLTLVGPTATEDKAAAAEELAGKLDCLIRPDALEGEACFWWEEDGGRAEDEEAGLEVELVIVFGEGAATEELEEGRDGLAREEAFGFDFGLLGPRTRPSFAYSQSRPRFMQRLQEGCSPLHCVK